MLEISLSLLTGLISQGENYIMGMGHEKLPSVQLQSANLPHRKRI